MENNFWSDAMKDKIILGIIGVVILALGGSAIDNHYSMKFGDGAVDLSPDGKDEPDDFYDGEDDDEDE